MHSSYSIILNNFQTSEDTWIIHILKKINIENNLGQNSEFKGLQNLENSKHSSVLKKSYVNINISCLSSSHRKNLRILLIFFYYIDYYIE